MHTVWFTSDTHFGHTNILKWRHGFASIEAHDEILIENWNRLVKKGDVVHHLGDFAWRSVESYRKRLRGNIHLVLGNHDRLKPKEESLFASVKDYKSVKVQGQPIYLMHYAMRIWNRSHYGTWHLFGHSHGTLPDDPDLKSLDVGVDVHNFRPIAFEEVREFMAKKTWKPIDHHR